MIMIMLKFVIFFIYSIKIKKINKLFDGQFSNTTHIDVCCSRIRIWNLYMKHNKSMIIIIHGFKWLFNKFKCKKFFIHHHCIIINLCGKNKPTDQQVCWCIDFSYSFSLSLSLSSIHVNTNTGIDDNNR